MSVRELYGWTPRTFTRHTYDDVGRPLETVSWTESRWSPAEVSLLLASRRQNVGPHGVPMDEALDDANAGRFRVKVTRDYAQMAVNKTRHEYEKNYPHDDLSALMFRAELPAEEVQGQADEPADDAGSE